MKGFTKKLFDMPVRICIQQIILVYFAELYYATLKWSRLFRRQCIVSWWLFSIEIWPCLGACERAHPKGQHINYIDIDFFDFWRPFGGSEGFPTFRQIYFINPSYDSCGSWIEKCFFQWHTVIVRPDFPSSYWKCLSSGLVRLSVFESP